MKAIKLDTAPQKTVRNILSQTSGEANMPTAIELHTIVVHSKPEGGQRIVFLSSGGEDRYKQAGLFLEMAMCAIDNN